MPHINVKKTDTIEDIAKKIGAEYSSQICDQIRDIAPPTPTAESALAAVYAAIEKHSQYPNGDTDLQGLAALVTALKPNLPQFDSVFVSGAADGIKAAKLPQYTEM